MTDPRIFPDLSLAFFFLSVVMKPAHYVVTRKKTKSETNEREKKKKKRREKKRTTCLRHIIKYQSMAFDPPPFITIISQLPKQLDKKVTVKATPLKTRKTFHPFVPVE